MQREYIDVPRMKITKTRADQFALLVKHFVSAMYLLHSSLRRFAVCFHSLLTSERSYAGLDSVIFVFSYFHFGLLISSIFQAY